MTPQPTGDPMDHEDWRWGRRHRPHLPGGRAGAERRADLVVSQGLLLALVLGLPFVALGLIIPDRLIAVFRPEPEVIALGAVYLRLIYAMAPFRTGAVVLARSFQVRGTPGPPWPSISSQVC